MLRRRLRDAGRLPIGVRGEAEQQPFRHGGIRSRLMPFWLPFSLEKRRACNLQSGGRENSGVLLLPTMGKKSETGEADQHLMVSLNASWMLL
jgi:hypothetical protein